MYAADVTDTATCSSSYASSEGSSRELLFGEIESTVSTSTLQSFRTTASGCNLTLSSSSTFLKFWLCDNARDAFMSHLSRADLCNLRSVCHDFSNRAAPILFQDIKSTFKSKTFTRPARMAALERIGGHVKSLQVIIDHSDETLLPPLIDPETGEEMAFVYEPQSHSPATLIDKVKNPKYGSWMLADLLIKQYPPLFHAATNVPSFIRAFSALHNLTNLSISCPGGVDSQSSRRSIVDYCLISLRIAIERASLDKLKSISLLPIHEEGLFYLQPTFAFGATPRAIKRWSQIENLTIQMTCNDTRSSNTANSMKILHSYLQNFSRLRRLHFRWDGCKGPCPVSLHNEPQLRKAKAPESECGAYGLRRLRFGQLEYMLLGNATVDAAQITAFIGRHRKTLNEFSFEDVQLRSGNWHEALAPLSQPTKRRKEKHDGVETMDVPVFLSPEHWGDTAANQRKQPLYGKQNCTSLGKLWSKAKVTRTSSKAKEQIIAGSEHVKKLLRYSVLGWR